jgi:hypothetical protein
LAQDENGTAVGFDATRVGAMGAEAFTEFSWRAIVYRRHIF